MIANHEIMALAAKSVEHSGWCSPLKAAMLAAITLDLAEIRPIVAVEIGVWTGSSLIPILLGVRQTGSGIVHAIDAWSPSVSVRNEAPANQTWWGSVDHDDALRRFRERLDAYEVARFCEIHRAESGACDLSKICRRAESAADPSTIDLLHIDGSHTDQAIMDVRRFGTAIRPHGILVMDDVGWEGGGVDRAILFAKSIGFRELYQIETWMVLERQQSKR
jgi:predicted O-methyltransferase YrrM